MPPVIDNFHRPIASILDVLDELEAETRHYLQNPAYPVHGVPGEPVPAVPRAPTQDGINLRCLMGEEYREGHQDPPVIIWTLGDVNLTRKVERRTPRPRLRGAALRPQRQQPKAFRKAGTQVTAHLLGSLDQKESNPRRKSVRGTERLLVSLLWALHAHWHGVIHLETGRWTEVPGATIRSYGFMLPFRVDLALLRPEQGLTVVRGIETTHEIETPPTS